MAQSVGTPGGESDTQDLHPRSAQFFAGDVTSGLRMNVFRAKVKLKLFTMPGLKIWVSLSVALCVTQLLPELNAGSAAFCSTKKSSQKYRKLALLADEKE